MGDDRKEVNPPGGLGGGGGTRAVRLVGFGLLLGFSPEVAQFRLDRSGRTSPATILYLVDLVAGA